MPTKQNEEELDNQTVAEEEDRDEAPRSGRMDDRAGTEDAGTVSAPNPDDEAADEIDDEDEDLEDEDAEPEPAS